MILAVRVMMATVLELVLGANVGPGISIEFVVASCVAFGGNECWRRGKMMSYFWSQVEMTQRSVYGTNQSFSVSVQSSPTAQRQPTDKPTNTASAAITVSYIACLLS